MQSNKIKYFAILPHFNGQLSLLDKKLYCKPKAEDKVKQSVL